MRTVCGSRNPVSYVDQFEKCAGKYELYRKYDVYLSKTGHTRSTTAWIVASSRTHRVDKASLTRSTELFINVPVAQGCGRDLIFFKSVLLHALEGNIVATM